MADDDMFKPPAERAAAMPPAEQVPRATFAGGMLALDYLENTQTVVPAKVQAERPVNPVRTLPPRPAPVEPVAVVAPPAQQVEPSPAEEVIDAMPTYAPFVAPTDPRHAFVPPATVHKRFAERGLRGAMARAGLKVAPSAADLAQQLETEAAVADENTIRQATWPRAVGILVANRKGGVGKTPTSLVMGGILASIRGGSVSILEVSDDPGSLEFRAEGEPRMALGELVRDLEHVDTAGQLDGYTSRQSSFAAVIGSAGRRQRLTRDAVTRVSALLDRFYSIRVMDSGNQPTSEAFAGAVAAADVLVIPIMDSGEAVLGADSLLRELAAAGEKGAALARTAIVIRITDGRPIVPTVRNNVTATLSQLGLDQVFEIPFDAHLAEGGDITLSKLSPSTHRAFTAAAAAVIREINSHVK